MNKDKKYKRVFIFSMALVLPVLIVVFLVGGLIFFIYYAYVSSERCQFNSAKQLAISQPGNFNAQRSIADKYYDYGECPLAIKYYEKALEIRPEDLKTMNKIANCYTDYYEDYEKAINYYQKTLKKDVSNEISLKYYLESLKGAGKYKELLVAIDKYKNQLPGSVDVNFLKANAYKGLKEYFKAEDYYRKSIKENNSDNLAYLALVGLLIKQKRYNDLQILVKDNDKNFDNCSNSILIAYVYERIELTDKAIDQYKIVSTCEDNPVWVKQYARAKIRVLKNKDLSDLPQKFKTLIQKESKFVDPQIEVINLYLKTANSLLDKEINDYILLNDDKLLAYMNLANVFFKNGNNNMAHYYLDLAEALTKDNNVLYILKAKVFIKENQYKKALLSLKQAETLDQNDFQVQYLMAKVYFLLNDTKNYKIYENKLEKADQFWQDKLIDLKT